jgi:fluoride ion exporter CrcB/FEX
MNTVSVKADAKFLRRVLFGLMGLTLMTGAVAGFTTVQTMKAEAVTCTLNCK